MILFNSIYSIIIYRFSNLWKTPFHLKKFTFCKMSLLCTLSWYAVSHSSEVSPIKLRINLCKLKIGVCLGWPSKRFNFLLITRTKRRLLKFICSFPLVKQKILSNFLIKITTYFVLVPQKLKILLSFPRFNLNSFIRPIIINPIMFCLTIKS